MVEVVTKQAAEAENVEVVQAAEETAAEELATAAQDSVQDDAAEPEEVSSEQQDWDDLLLEEDDGVLPEEVKAEAKEEAPEAIPEDTQEEALAPIETPPEEAEEEEPEVTEDVEIPAVEEATEETRTSDEIKTEVVKARETARENLVDSFKWTEDQEADFEADPGKVMSNMAADLFLDLYDSISQTLRTQMPGMVSGIIAQADAVRQNEQRFYNAWPKLAKPEFRATIDRISTTYRQQNPTMDNETAVKEIGAQAWVALRLPIEELVAQSQAVAPEITSPVVVPLHVPASAGNAPVAARAPVTDTGNEYEQLANELLQDDKE